MRRFENTTEKKPCKIEQEGDSSEGTRETEREGEREGRSYSTKQHALMYCYAMSLCNSNNLVHAETHQNKGFFFNNSTYLAYKIITTDTKYL